MCKAERDTLKCKCFVLKALLCYDWELWRVIRSSVCVRILTSVCIDCLPLNVYSLQQWSNESLLHSSWRQQDVCVRMCECECVFVCVCACCSQRQRVDDWFGWKRLFCKIIWPGIDWLRTTRCSTKSQLNESDWMLVGGSAALMCVCVCVCVCVCETSPDPHRLTCLLPLIIDHLWWFLYIHSSTFQGNQLTKCYWTEWWCKDPSFNQLVSRWNMNC